MKKSFKEFIDKKQRDAAHQLKTIKKLLEKNGFTVESYLTKDDPYIFLNSNNDQLSFGGVRIYKIGSTIAYRVQKENITHPYGASYCLNVEDMYNDLLSEYGDEEKCGKIVINSVVAEFISFFKKSHKSERQLSAEELERNGKFVSKNATLDYSSSVANQMI
jgi:hypothetical protein